MTYRSRSHFGDDVSVDLGNVLSLNLNLSDILSVDLVDDFSLGLGDSLSRRINGDSDGFGSDSNRSTRDRLNNGLHLRLSHFLSNDLSDIRQPQSGDVLASVWLNWVLWIYPSNLAAETIPSSTTCLFFMIPCLPAAYLRWR